MATSFSSLPLVDLSPLSSENPFAQDLASLAQQLDHVFSTTGFAYLVNPPLSLKHEDVFRLAESFFSLPSDEKMSLAKKTFVKENKNTYRGYFPPQPGQQDNLKEGLEIGPTQKPETPAAFKKAGQRFQLGEENVWPQSSSFNSTRFELEQLYGELQTLSSTLLSLVAVALGKQSDFFASFIPNSISTLRLLHYPPQAEKPIASPEEEPALCCTPHTDSGILTLLHQDTTGGLEVKNSNGEWVSAPYVPNSIVVNIGDLMSTVSGGKYVATLHRVRTCHKPNNEEGTFGRFSVPFFFEPGEACLVKSVNDDDEGIIYGEYVRRKMNTWVEYQDVEASEGLGEGPASSEAPSVGVAA